MPGLMAFETLCSRRKSKTKSLLIDNDSFGFILLPNNSYKGCPDT
jgi:hypothetical protein